MTAHVLVLGAGPSGLAAAVLLAGDGHRVTVLDRDADGPGVDAAALWESWRRPGVSQFRHPHLLLPSGFALLEEEIPEAVGALEGLGARPHNLIAGAWRIAEVGPRRPGDERFRTLAACRPVLEAALAAVAARTEGVRIRRGVAAAGLVTRGGDGRPQVAGAVTGDGETVLADLVVDATGRRTPVPRMLREAGAPGPSVERAAGGFCKYGRFFRVRDEGPPCQAPWPIDHHPTVTTITAPGDNGTWSMLLVSSGRDHALRALRDERAWQRAAALFPDIAHWASIGEPITGVRAMAGVRSRRYRYVVGGVPVLTGLLPLGDAWATTDPQFGLGLSMGLVHAVRLREVLRAVGVAEPDAPAVRFDEVTEAELAPVYRRVRDWDRHRLAEIDGELAGVPYESEDPGWLGGKAMDAVKLRDPQVLRGLADIASMLADPDEVLARPDVAARVERPAADVPRFTAPGPTRGELLAALGG